MRTITAVLLVASATLSATPANAQLPEAFYRGKALNLIIPNAPGGSFDLYARFAANHLGRFIPGNPSIVAQNMPGAAGMQAATYLAGIAPKDGTTLSALAPNISRGQILGVHSNAHYRPPFH